MTKGVPNTLRICIICEQSYAPTSGPQKYCIVCRPMVRTEYNKDWARRNPNQKRLIDRRASIASQNTIGL